MSSSPSLCDRAALAREFSRLWTPIAEVIAREGPCPGRGRNIAQFGEPASSMQACIRPVWGAAPCLAGGDEPALWAEWLRALARGVDPEDADSWREPEVHVQVCVEMGAVAAALVIAPREAWSGLSALTRARMTDWLASMDGVAISQNNWLFFRVFTQLARRALGAQWNRDAMHADLDKVETFYRGEGWYTDGDTQQRDYYIPSAFHFYGLIYARHCGEEDPERAGRFRERARLFAPQFAAWFARSGAALPIGRSLSYRFIQGAFWGALAYAGEEALPWGVVKRLHLQHLRWWFAQGVTGPDGRMTIGYTGENARVGEGYIAEGSVYWAFKAFLPLALPETHPFWVAEETEYEVPAVFPQPRAGLVLCQGRGGAQVWALSNNRPPAWPLSYAEARYSRFAYSTEHGFNFPDAITPAAGAGDSMLLVGCEGRWRGRETLSEERVEGDILVSAWQPWPEMEIVTWLIPVATGHVRQHRVRSPFPWLSWEGGFPAADGAGPPILDVSGGRRPVTVPIAAEATLHSRPSVLPGLEGTHAAGETWLVTVVAAAVSRPGLRCVGRRRWLDGVAELPVLLPTR